MHVELVRSGGLGGLSLAASVDASALAPDDAAVVHDALGRVDLASLSRRPPGEPSGPDRFQYDITVTAEGETHSLSLEEGEVPAELRPLIQTLVRLARPPS